MMGEMATSTAQLAGFWRRFASAVIDGVIVSIVASIIGVILVHGSNRQVGTSGIQFLLGLAYYTWGFGSGQTLGCRVMSLKIVDQNTGGVPGYSKGLIRYLVSIVSAIALLIGYLWMLWDDKKQTWHDKAAGTLVVFTGDASNTVTFNSPR